jgi:hypothetical protein
VARALAIALSLNRTGFGLAYLVAPGRTGPGWIGRAAKDPATQVFVRGHGARDVGLGLGALLALASRGEQAARSWMAAQALADASDVAATLLAGERRLPRSGYRFALAMAGVSTATALAAAAGLGGDAREPAA